SPGLALAYDDHQGELQAHELSTSGERSVLVERLLQHKVPMRRLFRALKQEKLLTEAQPLRSEIDRLLTAQEDQAPASEEQVELNKRHLASQVAFCAVQDVETAGSRVRRRVMRREEEDDEDGDVAAQMQAGMFEHFVQNMAHIQNMAHRNIGGGVRQTARRSIAVRRTARRTGPQVARVPAANAPPGPPTGGDMEMEEGDAEDADAADMTRETAAEMNQLRELEDMGFQDRRRNAEVLASVHGNLQAAIGILVNLV
ncbi:hypothetical protein CYMTET_7113, partial [Cymbomonas tetramitiformis]